MAGGDAHSVIRALDAASATAESAGDPLKDSGVCLLTPSETEGLMNTAHQSGVHGEQIVSAASDVARSDAKCCRLVCLTRFGALQ